VVRASWQGPGGSIVAECQGPQIWFVDIPVESGYGMSAWSTERRLVVTFRSLADPSAGTDVFASCQRGTPAFFASNGEFTGRIWDYLGE
jgi:hypothetical protein